jgi:hypothetical protein
VRVQSEIYYNALRGGWYYPFITREKHPARKGKTARKRARKEVSQR